MNMKNDHPQPNQFKLRTRSGAVWRSCTMPITFALAACGSERRIGSSSGADISIKNLTFSRTRLSVKAGATVTVKNDDTVTHTVTPTTGKSFNITVNAGQDARSSRPRHARHVQVPLQHPLHDARLADRHVAKGGR